MSLLARDELFFQQRHAGITAKEIAQQPALWRKLAEGLQARREEIFAFMQKIEQTSELRTVFAGAGSSAFVGESMQMLLAEELGLRGEAVHTTDIVASPRSTLPNIPMLLVSYARSGDSPESVGAIQYAAEQVDTLYQLAMVCKEDSALGRFLAQERNTLVLAMPPEACDQGFAMTSSVSCMALATWCVFGWRRWDEHLAGIASLAERLDSAMHDLHAMAQKAAAWTFERAVFLGNGALRGLSREAAIKMMELTTGDVNAGWDTPMGFRHGPKSVINGSTVTVHFLSPLSFTRRYDDDLLAEIASQRKGNKVIAIAAADQPALEADMAVAYPSASGRFEEMGAYIFGLIFAQLFAMEKSIMLGKETDNPCSGGELSRVVSGVTIYPLGE